MKYLIIFLMALLGVASISTAETIFTIVNVDMADYQKFPQTYNKVFTNIFINSTTSWYKKGDTRTPADMFSTNGIIWYVPPATGIRTNIVQRYLDGKVVIPGFVLVEVKHDVFPYGTNTIVKIRKKE